MELFHKRPPSEIEMIVKGFLRLLSNERIQIPDLIIRICACLYHPPVIWDQILCHEDIKLNADCTMASTDLGLDSWYPNFGSTKPDAWLTRTVFISGNYDAKTEQVFKFRVSINATIHFGISDITQYDKSSEEYKRIVSRYVGSEPDTFKVTIPYHDKMKGKTKDIVSVHLTNGKIQFRMNGKQIDYTRRIKNDMKFKIGMTMYCRSSEVEILYD